jgi:hypothetical protein
VLDRLPATARRFQQDAQVLSYLLLADVLGQQSRAEGEIELVVVGPGVQYGFVSRRHAGLPRHWSSTSA